jgi:hypothetical protein
MHKDESDEYERERQERTLPFPFTYAFYTSEHFMDAHNFDIRYCNIGRGRIIAHFDDRNLIIRGHQGHIDLQFKAEGDDTVLSMSTSYYHTLKDEDLFKFRKEFLTTVGLWMEREYSMTLPAFSGDIPRFRSKSDGAAMIDRSIELEAPDMTPLVRQLLYLGSFMMFGGVIFDLLVGFLPSIWGLVMAILTGLPFMVMAVMIHNGDFELVMKHYSFFGWMAGLIFCMFTLLLGVLIVMFPAAMVDYHATRIRVWNRYIDDVGGRIMGEGSGPRSTSPSPANEGKTPEVNVVGGMI